MDTGQKQLMVVNAHTGQETAMKISEGATALDILAQLNLPEPGRYVLNRVRNRHMFQSDSDVFNAVKDRERLFFFAAIDIGRPSWAA